MKAIDKAKSFLKKYRHAWVLSYFLIYMPWFVYLEKRTDVRHYMIHSPIDNHIPFIEYFIIPYLLWFIFIAVTVAYFLIKDKWGFYRLCAFLFSGMTIFLIICTVFPNALNLPEGQEQVRATIAAYMANAARIRSGIEGMGLSCYGGIHAPYIWVKTPDGMGSWEFFDLLLSRTSLVCTPGAGFGPSGEGYVRFTAFGSEEDTTEALERLQGLSL